MHAMTVLERMPKHLSAALAIALTLAGGVAGGFFARFVHLPLPWLLGPLFATRHEMFSDDQFHPSAAGYAVVADTMLPSVLDALGMQTRARSASAFTTRRPKPLAKAVPLAI